MGGCDWLTIFTGLLAVFTGLLALFTFILAVIACRQIFHLRRTERAYVSGGGFFPTDQETGLKSDRFSLRVDNYGKTPAYVEYVEIGYWDLSKGNLPEDFPGGKPYDLYNNVRPGEQSLPTDVYISRSEMTGDLIFGRFYYRDIFSKQPWWPITRKVRWSTFILRIDGARYVWPYRAPSAYTDWT